MKKYSDQAHFIYELIQNADDVRTTKVEFRLESNRLIFIYNGLKYFSVSDPKNEEKDSGNKILGDINAITSIANSNKEGETIGKFGVGFKTVFQYTTTPYIHDPEFKFKIERFLVPILLENSFPDRKENETVFVFPFNHQERDADEAYSEISDKLKSLSSPLLFLSNLNEIKFRFENTAGFYEKNVMEESAFGDTKAELISL